MQGLNKVELLGTVAAEPKIITGAGGKFASLRIATTEEWKDKSTGEMKSASEYHSVVVYHPQISEVVEKLVQQGTVVFIMGKNKTRKYTDNSGAEKYATEVVIDFNGSLTCLANTKSVIAPPQASAAPVSNAQSFEQAAQFFNGAPGDIPF